MRIKAAKPKGCMYVFQGFLVRINISSDKTVYDSMRRAMAPRGQMHPLILLYPREQFMGMFVV